MTSHGAGGGVWYSPNRPRKRIPAAFGKRLRSGSHFSGRVKAGTSITEADRGRTDKAPAGRAGAILFEEEFRKKIPNGLEKTGGL
jgi:hypothetical protein